MSAAAADMRARLRRWPLANQPSNRGESPLIDARLVNCYVEQDPNTGDYQIEKRIGLGSGYTVANGTIGRGCYPWSTGLSNLTDSYNIFGTNSLAYLYKDNTQIGSSFTDNVAAGLAQFAETQGSTRYLVFATFAAGIHYTDGTSLFAPGTAPAQVGSLVGLTYLDGTLYTMDQACNIFGSNIDDPSTFPALNLVIARAVGGTGVGMAQQLNYVIALKTNSMEVFYDAGNAVGSPLSPLPGATTNFGCLSKDTIQTIDNVVFYITSNKTLSPQVVRIDNLVPTIISTPAIERILAIGIGGRWLSFTFKIGGHRFYGVTALSGFGTVIYDIDQRLWYEWTDSAGAYFKCSGTSISPSNTHLLQGPTDGTMHQFDLDSIFPTDNGVVVPVDVYTPNADFGTRRRKVLHRMYFQSDQVTGSKLYVSYSDDDYQNWSVPRTVNLGLKTPYIDNQGTFTRRAYHFRHASPTPFRLRSADLQMDLGTI